MQVRMLTLTLIAMLVQHGLVYEYSWVILLDPIIANKYTLILIIRSELCDYSTSSEGNLLTQFLDSPDSNAWNPASKFPRQENWK